MADVIIQIDGLKELIGNVNVATSQVVSQISIAMSQSVNQIKNDAQVLAPFQTGTLRRSIYADIQDSGMTGIVAQDPDIAPYGAGIEFGTQPHDIYPVNKKALYWAGALHPVRHVSHPGNRPMPFLVPAFEKNIEAVKGYFSDAVKRILLIAAGQAL